MAKRGRRELARLNAQTQFSLEWPATPPAAEERLVRAVKVLGNASRAMGGELRPGLVLGVNAVTRALEQTVDARRRPPDGGDRVGGGDIARILIARHARQVFVQHLPILALQAGHVRGGGSETERPAESQSSPPSFGMVKVCGLPLTSSKLGEMFGIRSVAALAIRAGQHLDNPEYAAVAAAARDEYALNAACFRNFDAQVLLLRHGTGRGNTNTGASSGDKDRAERLEGARRKRRRRRRRRGVKRSETTRIVA